MTDFDLDFELDVLRACLREEAYLKRAVRVCESHHFANKEVSWCWGVIRDTWTKFRERTNGRIFSARAADDFPDAGKRKPYLSLAVRLLKEKPTAPKSALDELEKFVRHVELQLALEKSAEALEKGALDDAEAAIQKAGRSRVAEKPYTHIQWIEGFSARQEARRHEREHPEEFTTIPTGFKRLDKVLRGGVRIGEVGLVMGTTGRGKSISLNNLGMAAVARRTPTVYFALEMPARQVAARQDARWSMMRYDQFQTYDFKPSELRVLEEKYRRAAKRFAGMFHILSLPVRSATIQTIRGALEDLKDEFDFRPQLILMDSADHLMSADKSLKDFRLQQADVYWQLKRLAEENGYAIWSSTHAGREWAHAIATAEATSETYDKARIADLIVTINDPDSKPGWRRKTVVVDDDDEEEEAEVAGYEPAAPGVQKLEMYLAKYRDGASKLRIELECDFARMVMKEKPSPDDEESEKDE